MPAAALLVPGSIESLSGGSIYDARVASGLRARGWTIDLHELDAAFPAPTAAALANAAAVLERLPDRTTTIIDGLALSAMADILEPHRARLRIVALVHMPLAHAFGLDSGALTRIRAAERRALECATLVVVTGASSIRPIERYGIARDRIAVVEPGTDRMPQARGSTTGRIEILCVGALTPGKGHAVLFEALEQIGCAIPWRLTCAGSRTRDPGHVERLEAMLGASAIADRVRLIGEVGRSELPALYDGADMFALATLSETYGMAVAEAIAWGLPVVSTRTGAIATLAGCGAGVVVEPGDARAFGAALERILTGTAARAQMREGALRARAQLKTWDDAVSLMERTLERVQSDE